MLMVAAIAAMGVIYAVSLVGVGPLDVLCWLEVTCPR